MEPYLLIEKLRKRPLFLQEAGPLKGLEVSLDGFLRFMVLLFILLISLVFCVYSRTFPYEHLSNTDSSLGPRKMPIRSL